MYYAAFAASRATRLYVGGTYSTDVADHKKISDFPDDFPDKARYSNKLSILREDRNTCDYDHASRAADLIIPTAEAVSLVKEFLEDTKKYLASKGLMIKGKL